MREIQLHANILEQNNKIYVIGAIRFKKIDVGAFDYITSLFMIFFHCQLIRGCQLS